MTLEWASLATAVSRVKISNWDFRCRHMKALNVAFEIEKLFKGLRTMWAREFFRVLGRRISSDCAVCFHGIFIPSSSNKEGYNCVRGYS